MNKIQIVFYLVFLQMLHLYKILFYYTKLTVSASMTVPTPTVNASFGTLPTSLSKNLAFASSVSRANVFTLVLDANEDPGSLNAIWPSGPIPVRDNCKNQTIKNTLKTIYIMMNYTQRRKTRGALIPRRNIFVGINILIFPQISKFLVSPLTILLSLAW